MKYKYLSLGIVLCSALMTGCTEDISELNNSTAFIAQEGKDYYFYINQQSFDFSNYEDKEQFIYNIPNDITFTMSSDAPDWLSIADKCIVASKNTSTNSRQAIFTINANLDNGMSFPYTMSATQSGAEGYLRWEDNSSSATISGKEQTINIPVDTNFDDLTLAWSPSYSTTPNNHVNLSYDKDKKQVIVHVNGNSSSNTLYFYVTASAYDNNYGSREITYSFTQKPADINVTPSSLTMAARGETKKVSVSSECALQTSSEDTWISVSPENIGIGTSEVAITVSANNTKSSRTGYVSIGRTGINVYQNAPTTSVSSASISIDAVGGTKTTTVNTDVAVTPTTNASWLSLSPGTIPVGQTELRITAQPNSSSANCSAIIQIGSASVTVNQNGAKTTVEGNTVKFGANGGTASVTVKSDVTVKSSPSDNWISVSPENIPIGTTELKITALPNETSSTRSGSVTVGKQKISVEQEGQVLSVSSNNVKFKASANDNKTFNVTSTGSWKINDIPEWLTVTPSEGAEGTTTVSISTQDNNSTLQRTADLKVEMQKFSLSKSITVTQEGATADVGSSLQMPWNSSTATLSVGIPAEWTVNTNADWITLSKTSGSGKDEVSVTTQTNTSKDERYCKISFSSEGNEYTTNVTQQGQYLNVTGGGNGNYDWKGGNFRLSVSGTVSTNEPSIEYLSGGNDWINISNKSILSGNTGYTVTVTENNTTETRKANIVIMPSQTGTTEAIAQGVKMVIVQTGRMLEIYPQKIYFNQFGGDSKKYTIVTDGSNVDNVYYTIVTDGNYSIEKPAADNWYTLKHNTTDKTLYVIVNKMSDDMTERTGQIDVCLKGSSSTTGTRKSITIKQVNTTKIDFNGFGEDEIW